MDTQQGFYLGIRFQSSEKSYYFSCPSDDFVVGDLVIVMTANGVEAGKVSIAPQPLGTYSSNLELKPIVRKADERDIRDYEQNLVDAKRALALTRKSIADLNLPMDLIDAFYTIDGSRITITYTSSEKRVDFRELLKVLAPQLGCRIELRQIASRDKAKMVGGIGICGLPLCCSSFLNQFEGISIQRAKNQMLTLNIPKLSGPCGKLICCLTYEDDAYTEAKKEFPRIGSPIKLDEGVYSVDSYNILSRTVRLVDAAHTDYKTFSLEDIDALQKGTYVKKVEIVKAPEEKLPSFGIEKPRIQEEKPAKQEQKNQNQNRRDHKDRRDNQNQNRRDNAPQNNGQQKQQNNQNDNNQNRNRNKHHHHNRHNEDRGQQQQQNQQRPNNRPAEQQNQNRPNDQQQKSGGNRNRHRRFHHGHRGGNESKGGEQ